MRKVDILVGVVFRAVKTLRFARWLSALPWVVLRFWWNQMVASRTGKAWVFLAGSVTVVQMVASLGVVAMRWTRAWNHLPLELSSLGLSPECQAPNLSSEIFY